jgi:hypothetical protein
VCISTPNIGAQSVQTPTQTTATDLQLGTAAIANRQQGIYGRLALTGGARGAAARAVSGASNPAQGPDTTAASPGGTLGGASNFGLPTDFAGNPIYGGLKSVAH